MTNKSSSSSINKVKLGPDPILLSRKEVDALYETLQAVKSALDELHVDYIVTGGSLLGAIRQHSILFCDDDIDLAIIDYDGTIYNSIVVPHLQERLGTDFVYQIKPWEGGDRIRPKRMSNIFLDLFVLRRYESDNDLIQVIGKKKNGQLQSETYVQQILQKITSSAHSQGETSPIYPCWHCPKCDEKQCVTKCLRMATAPSVLVCHLKRFADLRQSLRLPSSLHCHCINTTGHFV